MQSLLILVPQPSPPPLPTSQMGHSCSKPPSSRRSRSPDHTRSSDTSHRRRSPHTDHHSSRRDCTSPDSSGRKSLFGIGSKHNQTRSSRSLSPDREQSRQLTRDKPKRVSIDTDYDSDTQPSRNPNKKRKLDQKPSADDNDNDDGDVEDRITLTEEQKRRKRVEQLNLVLVEGEVIKTNAGRKVEKGYVISACLTSSPSFSAAHACSAQMQRCFFVHSVTLGGTLAVLPAPSWIFSLFLSVARYLMVSLILSKTMTRNGGMQLRRKHSKSML